MHIRIDFQGGIHCLYTESLDLAALGPLCIRRASYVEPDVQGNWWADLSPLKGPQLGPFAIRTLALKAEQTWLELNWL